MSIDRKQLMEDAGVLADMAQRILGNGGEPNYCGEKAERAAKAAVRILARCDAALGARDDGGVEQRLHGVYVDEYDYAAADREQER